MKAESTVLTQHRPPGGGWKVLPLGALFKERKGTVNDVDFPPLSVTKSGVVPQLITAAKSDQGDNRRLVRAGDFVINSRSDRKGSAGISPFDGSVSLVYTVLIPGPTVEPRFAHHLLRSQPFQEEFFRWGTGIVDDLWSTRFSSMKRIELSWPPLTAQAAIADFLDRETARIDTLIEKQEKLIETLRERRFVMILSLISPPVLPSNWVEGQLRRFARFVTGKTPIGDLGEVFDAQGSLPWIRPEDLGYPTTSRIGLRGDGIRQLHVIPASSALICGIGATLAKPGYIDRPATTNQQVTALVSTHSGKFLYYKLLGSTQQIWALSVGNTLPIINNERLGSLRISMPPRQDQDQLVQKLDFETARIDHLIAKAQRFIELAQERRSALITAAVTGQLDVGEPAVG